MLKNYLVKLVMDTLLTSLDLFSSQVYSAVIHLLSWRGDIKSMPDTFLLVVTWLLFHLYKENFEFKNKSIFLHIINAYIFFIDYWNFGENVFVFTSIVSYNVLILCSSKCILDILFLKGSGDILYIFNTE